MNTYIAEVAVITGMIQELMLPIMGVAARFVVLSMKVTKTGQELELQQNPLLSNEELAL